MKKVLFLRALAVPAALGLVSCSWIARVPGGDRLVGDEGLLRDRQADYLEAATIPRTRVSDRYDSYIIDDLYVIPELPSASQDSAFLDAPRPRPIEGRSEREVVIQSIGERRWVIVDAAPSQVWPRVRDYWTAKGVSLAVENPARGMMETNWFNLQSDTLNRERFRILFEPGFQDDSTEIRLLHTSMPQAVPLLQEVEWPEASANPQLETEFLNEMAGYLADVSGITRTATVSFMAGSISSEGRASLVQGPQGPSALRLDADWERSWAAVARALDRAGVEIIERDEEAGSYQVSFIQQPEVEEKGFFGRLFSFDDFRRGEASHHLLRVRLREQNGAVVVEVEPLAGPGQSLDTGEDDADAPAALLRALMSNIA